MTNFLRAVQSWFLCLQSQEGALPDYRVFKVMIDCYYYGYVLEMVLLSVNSIMITITIETTILVNITARYGLH